MPKEHVSTGEDDAFRSLRRFPIVMIPTCLFYFYLCVSPEEHEGSCCFFHQRHRKRKRWIRNVSIECLEKKRTRVDTRILSMSHPTPSISKRSSRDIQKGTFLLFMNEPFFHERGNDEGRKEVGSVSSLSFFSDSSRNGKKYNASFHPSFCFFFTHGNVVM